MQSVSKQRYCKHVYNNRCFPWSLFRVLIREVNSEDSDPTRVEAGSNNSTVTLRVVGGDEKRSLNSETEKYGHESQMTRTRERLFLRGPAAYKKDRPTLSSERATQKRRP
jgi:hypothetical protein